ncbi:MAG: cytidylate kinase-like family protein [Lachnospiraceae bacterium]|nr:cytidylate kinase-like family protein [Lachnospiraceae bacterium]
MGYNVIAIEREYGSGGSEIGEKLAAKLGIPCHDKEILQKAAAKTGLSTSELESIEESVTGSFLYSLYMLASISKGEGGGLTKAQKLAITESEIINDLALTPCVIIGRSAAGILKEKNNILKVFIHSDYAARIVRTVNIYHNDSGIAESILRRFDRRRADYFKANTGANWKDENIYHLFVNSGKLGIESAVDILYTAAMANIK